MNDALKETLRDTLIESLKDISEEVSQDPAPGESAFPAAEMTLFYDRLSHFLIEGVPVRVLEVQLRDTAREAIHRHEASKVGGAAMAQALIAASLLSGHIKGDERLTVQLVGRGTLGAVITDCSAEGHLRVKAQYPIASAGGADLEEQVQRAIGDGTFYVIKSTSERELYRGMAPLSQMDIAGALEVYLQLSEQILSACWTHIQFEGDTLATARGLMIQALGGERAFFEAFEKTLDRGEVQSRYRAGQSVIEIMTDLFPTHSVVEVEASPLKFQCRCSSERILNMLLSLGADELETILKEDGMAEITCEFCRTRYGVRPDQLAVLIHILRQPEN